MTRLSFIVLVLIGFIGFIGCDDGDIISFVLEFDGDLERCEDNSETYLIFDTKDDPSESLSITIPRNDENELLFTEPTPVGEPVELPINGGSTRFIYRNYNRTLLANELCDIISPGDLLILEDYEATTGSIFVTVTIEDDDQDGVPTIFEGRGTPDANGDFPDAIDTDGDDIPDYLDEDDDNDNVKTSFEIDNSDGDNDPSTNPLDTDGDGTPNYLDDDDDGDGTLTRLEDETDERNPRNLLNSEVDEMGMDVFRYLSNEFTEEFPDFGFTDNNIYNRVVRTTFVVTDIDIEVLRQDVVDFGTYVNDFDILPEED